MRPACGEQRMPWPCQAAWGIAIISVIIVLAVVIAHLQPTAAAPAAQEASHAQP